MTELPDGPQQQIGVGVIASFDFNRDRELWRWAPDEVTLFLARTDPAPSWEGMALVSALNRPEILTLQPAEIPLVPYPQVAELIRRNDHPDADALFVSCTGLATYDIIAPLERELGKPIITANQATVWGALRPLGRTALGPGQRLLSA